MSFKLPDLPYEKDALEPHISARTLDYHHGKHHRAYVEKLNKAVENTAYEGLPLESVIERSHGTTHTHVFNNAAQAWNHAFLWDSMSPGGGGEPEGELKDAIVRDFGDPESFRKAFKAAATGQFGSGWAWLVQDKDTLKILTTPNADTPLVNGQTPLLTLDVWEHAYYLDYQNDRGSYVDMFLDKLVNWEFAAQGYRSLRQAA